MRAIVASAAGVRIKERPVPVPRADEVLIRVLSAGICRTDGYIARNLLPVAEGRILGHEFCGMVEKAGSDTSPLLGKRVGVMPVFRDGRGFAFLGQHRDGAFAEWVAVPAAHTYPLPDALSDQEGAYLEPVAAALAVLKAPISRTMRGLVHGTGRIAELTGRILAAHGFDSVAVGGGDEEDSYDFAIETEATADALAQVTAQLKPCGLLLLKSRPHASVAMPVTRMVQKELRVQGVHYAPFEDAVTLLAERRIDVADLFGPTCSLEEGVRLLGGLSRLPDDKKIFIAPSL